MDGGGVRWWAMMKEKRGRGGRGGETRGREQTREGKGKSGLGVAPAQQLGVQGGFVVAQALGSAVCQAPQVRHCGGVWGGL